MNRARADASFALQFDVDGPKSQLKHLKQHVSVAEAPIRRRSLPETLV